jgi:tetratricopeptide (TPR) repeat protein
MMKANRFLAALHPVRLLISLSLIALIIPALALARDPPLGQVDFPVSCAAPAQQEMTRGVAQLHHMMYERARRHFEAAAAVDPGCAMAHWGMAMSRFQPLWHPASDEELDHGRAAVEAAREIRERGYISAAAAFFDPQTSATGRADDHEARIRSWKTQQRQLHEAFPEDVDAAAFYALAEVAYAQARFAPTDTPDFTRQQRAGALLERLYEEHPEHPGAVHYLIHAYDSAQLAHRAEHAARNYDRIAPDTPHALHMPGHIFVRLGRWEENAAWNERSAEAALRQTEIDPHASAHYVHALDYLMYSYLQLADEEKARQTLEAVRQLETIHPAPFAGYNTAAVQVRYFLEQGLWQEAAELEIPQPDALPWDRFPAAVALFHYARGLGSARTGDLDQAEAERDQIRAAVARLRDAGDDYWAHMTEALAGAVEAWVLYEREETDRALQTMREAADLEDSLEKHPTTPGEVLPVRELYGELLLREGRADEARAAFAAALERTPNRRNALAGLERAGGTAG